MAKMQIFGDSVVVTSSIDMDVLKNIRKYKPTQLKLVDKDTKDEVFAVSTGITPSFSKHGIVFTGKNAAGKAIATLPLPAGMTDAEKVDFVKDHAGYGLLNLIKVEAAIQSASTELNTEFETMDAAIEILGATSADAE